MLKTICVLLCLTYLSGCNYLSHYQQNQHIKHMRADALENIDADKCIAEGGKVEGVGMYEIPTCIKRLSDAGKVCWKKADCIGLCLAAPNAIVGTQNSTGRCQKDENDLFGCFNEITDGVVAPSVCKQ